MSNYILITDAFSRKSFDVISLVKKNFPKDKVILGLPSIETLSAFLSYTLAGNVSLERLRTDNYQVFGIDIARISDSYPNDHIVYLPMEETSTEYFLRCTTTRILPNIHYLLPSLRSYEIFSNKGLLNKYCLQYGFSAPKIYDIEAIDKANFPVLLKPCVGSGSRGIFRLYSLDDYTDSLKCYIQDKDYLVQELLPNGRDVHGTFFLCDHGKVISAYSHRRIRTSPETGGVTVYSRMDLNEKLIEQGEMLLQSVQWNGLIMLEYLYDSRCAEYKLIEANPRLWGSIMLSEYGGAFLLTNYIRLCLNDICLKPVIDTNKYIRWFLPMDIVLYIKSRGMIKGFWHFKNTCFINWSFARKDRAVYYFFYSCFKLSNLKRFFNRL